MPRKPTKRQREILSVLCRVARAQETDEVTYTSEWLGYLPFGAYHWIEIGDEHRVESQLPPEWGSRDLDALEASGLLEVTSHVAADEVDATTKYRITAAGYALAGATEPPRPTAPAPAPAPEPPAADLPPAKLIPGTATTDAGEVPFVFDPATGQLTRGHQWPHREPTAATRAQLASLAQAVRRELDVTMRQVRVGALRCRHCHEWFDILRQPNAWSFGMCLSCSLELSSEMGGD